MNKRFIIVCLFTLSFLLFFSTVSASDNNLNKSTDSFSSLSIDKKEYSVNNQNVKSDEKNTKTINIDSRNFDEYVTAGKFNEKVNNGDTVDIQGKLDSSKFSLTIDKPLNIISSTNNAYFDLNTTSLDSEGHYKNGAFNIVKGASGTNITGISFHNTRVTVDNVTNINIYNITVLNQQNVGNGVGSFRITGGSENITVANCTFTNHGTSHSNVVIAGASNCLIENNTIQGIGNSGNLLYATSYFASGENKDIIIKNNTIKTIAIPSSVAICWGLVLQGTGFIIENNYIDTNYPVMGQWSDSDYGVETKVEGIVFNNNTIARASANLPFPGIVSNNVFMDGANLKNNYAVNNTFRYVTLADNVKFENNTAYNIVIHHNNNTLINNEVFTDEDYAIIINGENNTLINNRLASFKGRGENAISSSIEYTSINNSADITRTFYINDNNLEKYFEYRVINNLVRYNSTFTDFRNDDLIYLNTSNDTVTMFNIPKTDTLRIVSDSLTPSSQGKLVLINSTVYQKAVSADPFIIIDSTVYEINRKAQLSNSNIMRGQYFTYPQNNTFVLLYDISSKYSIINKTSGYIRNASTVYSDDVKDGDTIEVFNYKKNKDTDVLPEMIYFNKKLDFISLPKVGVIDTNVSFIKGSKFSTVTGVTFNWGVFVNDSNIKFVNCTFNGDVEVNTDYNIFEGNIFNSKLLLNSANGLTFTNNTLTSDEIPINVINTRKAIIENNSINTSSDNTIVFDEVSEDNVVRGNVLRTSLLYGNDTVISNGNIVENNTPSYDTKIVIENDGNIYKNLANNVTVKVYNTFNDSLVDNGYVEVYLDGILQGIKPLENGQITMDLNTTKLSMGVVPLKVWYYNGITYSDNVTSINVNVVKSNITIDVEAFDAKFNENVTVVATFEDQRGQPLIGGNASFLISKESYNVEVVNGVATLNAIVTTDWVDSNSLTVSYPNTDTYNYNSKEVTLNISKSNVMITPSINKLDDKVEVALNITDDLNRGVINGKITLSTINGTKLAEGKVVDGKYATNITMPSDYKEDIIVANFTSYYYNGLTRNINISSICNSSITVETSAPIYGKELNITGKVVDSNNNIVKEGNVTLNINGNRVQVTTDNDGNYVYSYYPELGNVSIMATFMGTSNVNPSSTGMNVTVVDIDEYIQQLLDELNKTKEENIKLNDTVNNQSDVIDDLTNALKDQNSTIQDLNNNITDLKDDLEDANKQIGALNNNITNLNNQIKDLNNKNKDLQDKLTAANEKVNAQEKQIKDLQDQLNKANDKVNAQEKQVKDLTDKLNNADKTIANQNKTIQDLNNQVSQLNDKIKNLTTKTKTKVTVNKIATGTYASTVTINGTLNDANNKAINNGVVTIKLNAGTVKVVTNSKGVYAYKTTNAKVGTNNVTVTFTATDKYTSSSAKTTFKLNKATPALKINSISAVKFKDKVTVTGSLMDNNNKAISGAQITLKINSKSVTVKTAKDGSFTYTTSATSMGTNNVTATYNGNSNFNKVSKKVTFKVNKQNLILTVDRVASGLKYKDPLVVGGRLVDGNNKAVANTMVSLKFNGKTYKAKTDKNGYYKVTTRATTMGNNNLTAFYAGNAKYNKASARTTFTVAKQDIIITFDKVSYNNGKVTISGTFTDRNRHALMNSLARITLNGKLGTAKTNNKGTFTYTTKANKGTYKVTLAYPGNARYNAYSKTSTVKTA